jgi:hypothetical protein
MVNSGASGGPSGLTLVDKDPLAFLAVQIHWPDDVAVLSWLSDGIHEARASCAGVAVA